MGRKFKLSDMLPNAWFYRLRDVAVVNAGKNKLHLSQSNSSATSSSSSATAPPGNSRPNQPLPRKSYHFSRRLEKSDGFYDYPRSDKFADTRQAEPPRKSSKESRRRRTPAPSQPNLVGAIAESIWSKSDSPPDFSSSPFDSSPEGKFRTDTVSATESFHGAVNDNNTIVDDKNDTFTANARTDKHELARIITKSEKKDTKTTTNKKSSVKMVEMNPRRSLSVRTRKEENISMKEQKSIPSRKFSVNSPGVRLRVNSPRIGGRKVNAGNGRKSISSSSTSGSSGSNKSLSESLAIMKSSFDPQRDFRESMVEMIVENNIRASKDLEDLLACYLSLNADEYHDLIIKVFKQIWFDLSNAKVA